MALVLPASEYNRLPKYDNDSGKEIIPVLKISSYQNISWNFWNERKEQGENIEEVYELYYRSEGA